MASDFDKPASVVWNAADQMRSAAGKCNHKESTNIQMSVYKVPATGARSSGSSKTLSSKSEQSVELAQRNVQKNALEAAMDIQLLLTSAYYGASNLPYQIAQSPTGTLPHLGVFPSFGFSVPGYSVPVSPIAQGTSTVQPLYNVEQLQRTVKARSPRSNKANNRQPNAAQAHSVQKTVEGNAQRSQVSLPKASPVEVAISNANVQKSRPILCEKPMLEAGSSSQCNTGKLQRYPQPSCTSVQNKISTSCSTTSGRVSSTMNSRVHHSSQPISKTPIRTNQHHQHLSSFKVAQDCRTSKHPTSSKHSTVSAAEKFLINNLAVQYPKIGAGTADLASLNTYLSAALTQNAKRVNLLKSQNRSSMGDAEAAAILLGLRHGIANGDETPSRRNDTPGISSRNEPRKRTLNEVGSPISPTKRSRTSSVGSNSFQDNLATEAVDLSARKCHHTGKSPQASNSNINKLGKASTQATPTKSRVGYKQFGSDQITISSKHHGDRQSYDMSADGTVLADDSSPRRHFLSPVRNKSASESSTSLVTHLPSYICAFDCRTHLEGLPSYEMDDDVLMKSQHAAANNGFNFKKVICKKFTQSMTDTSDGQWEPMNECEEVFLSDKGKNSSLAQNTRVCFPKTKQLLPNNITSFPQSSTFVKERGTLRPKSHPLHTGAQIASNGTTNPIPVSRAGNYSKQATLEKSAEHAIDFRVKKRSSIERQYAQEHQIKKPIKPNDMTTTVAISRSQGPTQSKRSEPQIIHKSSIVAEKSAHSISQTNKKIGHEQKLFSRGIAIQPIVSAAIPSFSDLREKSRSHLNGNAIRNKSKSQVISDNGFNSTSSRHKHSREGKRALPVSNLYRIRKSGLGDSNDSLDSLVAESEEPCDDSDVMSDSSYSSCESGFSRNRKGSSSSCSDDEMERDQSEVEDIGVSHEANRINENSTRPRFVLNQPKFTLDYGKNIPFSSKLPSPGGKFSTRTESSVAPSLTKVKIRNPTFKFSSETQKPTQASKSFSFNSSPQTENKDSEDMPASQPGASNKVPELKCDEGESGQSFKAMLIRALTQGNQKEGVAVDGKSLRALLGEATCFYHNNKKYVLKKGPTKARAKKGFIADVEGKNGLTVPVKQCSKNDDKSRCQPLSLPSIEPRVSVTAIKKKKSRKNKIKSKKEKKKKLQQMNEELANSRHYKDPYRKSKNVTSDTVGDCASSDVTYQQNGGKLDHAQRRHRRIHEIENLVFEGAGGLTPIPDQSLRDSDVFTNIKLRRREAAKRRIIDSVDEQSPVVELKHKKSSKTKERKKLIKSAARERAVVNKSRKHSIEKKLEKYKKKKRIFLLNKKPEPSNTPRVSCVRINAGFLTPHPEVQAFAAQEIRKFRKNSVEIPEPMQSLQKAEGGVLQTTEKSNEGSSSHVTASSSKYGVDESHLTLQVDNRDSPSRVVCDATMPITRDVLTDGADEVTEKTLDEEMSAFIRPKLELKAVINPPSPEYINDEPEGSDKDSEQAPRYPKRTNARRKIALENADIVDKDRQKAVEDDQIEVSSDANCGESDSVRSDSPFRLPTKSSRHRKKHGPPSQGNKAVKSKSNQDSSTFVAAEKSNFKLLALFPIPPAITLGAALGDLEPSYSVKKLALGPDRIWKPKKEKSPWIIGGDATETKQQMQREFWKNMTIDMFCNKTASPK